MQKEIELLYLSDTLAVIAKPGGVSSGEDGAMPMLRALLTQRGEKDALFPVHRLDRETAGLMVFARTAEAAAFLSREIRDGGFEKTYLAELCGVPDEKKGTLRDLLFHDRQKNKTYIATGSRKGVKEAVLHYEVTDEKDGRATVRVRLETGRTHQIRVQFASRGLPLVGDRKYGGEKADRLHLTACELKFTSPEGERLEFKF